MRIIAGIFFCSFLALLWSCGHEKAGGTDASTPLQQSVVPDTFVAAVDTIHGFKGMDKASFRPLQKTNEFRYYQVIVRIAPGKFGEEEINISHPDTPLVSQKIPGLANAKFGGVYRDYLFVESGKPPEKGELHFFNLKRKVFVYGTNYIGEPQILSNGKLWYLEPIVYDSIPEKYRKDCEGKVEWEAQGHETGYGRRCMYDLVNGTVTQKSEYPCVELKK